jgi:redox-sensitive bicupin YhaK (pirin superfamily)
LPKSHAETDPGFTHYAKDAQPLIESEGLRVQVVAGELLETSAVKTLSPLFYGDVQAQAGATLVLPAQHEERTAYIVSGSVQVEGQVYGAGRLLVFASGRAVTIQARDATRFAVLGGKPLEGPRFPW